MRKVLYFLLVLLLLSSVSLAHAEDSGTDQNTGDNEIILDKRQTTKVAASERTEALKEKQASRAANMSARREALKEKIAAIKDKRKQSLVERIDEKLANVNKNITNQFVKALERISALLDKLEAKAKTLEENGADTTAFNTALEKARDDVATAQSAVSSQAGKEYNAAIKDEDSLKNTMGEVMQSLQADLKTIRELVFTAKKSAIATARELLKLRKPEKTDTDASSSADASQ